MRLTPVALRSWSVWYCLCLVLTAALPSLNAANAKPVEEVAGVTMETSAKQQRRTETPEQRDARMRWWREAKFGLFIHWGVYAVPAGKYGENKSYGEWIMHSAKIPVAEYRKYAEQFNPVKYNPEAWVNVANDAGMRYIVITSKHHDGFALYPSAASKWNVADATPYKKDLLGPLVSAAQGKGLKIGFYYSQSQDWNNPGGAKSGFKEGDGWDEAHKGSYDTYLSEVAVPQVRELLTQYPIDILWWDTPVYMTPQRTAPLAALLSLRPALVTNNRLGGSYAGDTATPEQFVPVTGYKGDWETCMTMNAHWGYNAYDQNWKSSTDLIRKLAEICAKGGNFLLNVGPTAEGEIPQPCIDRLREIGQWLKVNGDAIYGTKAGPFTYLSWGVATRKDDKLYLHVFNWPADGKLRVPLRNDAKAASLLASPQQKLAIHREAERLIIDVPARAPDAVDSVVVLQVAGEPIIAPLPTAGATVTATATLRGSDAANVVDGTAEKRWRAPKEVTSATLDIVLAAPSTVAAVGIDEPDVWPRLKQVYTLDVFENGAWRTLASGKSDGHGVKKAFSAVTADKFRLTMECAAGSPGVAELQLYRTE